VVLRRRPRRAAARRARHPEVAALGALRRPSPHARGPAETARKAVTKVLRTQIGKLLDLHPALGQHLMETVRMGTVCVYAPPTRTRWTVVFA
jgi:hypothetical protein